MGESVPTNDVSVPEATGVCLRVEVPITPLNELCRLGEFCDFCCCCATHELAEIFGVGLAELGEECELNIEGDPEALGRPLLGVFCFL
jgi:hypothetical protein